MGLTLGNRNNYFKGLYSLMPSSQLPLKGKSLTLLRCLSCHELFLCYTCLPAAQVKPIYSCRVSPPPSPIPFPQQPYSLPGFWWLLGFAPLLGLWWPLQALPYCFCFYVPPPLPSSLSYFWVPALCRTFPSHHPDKPLSSNPMLTVHCVDL